MLSLDREIAENYGLEVRGIVPYKDTNLLSTNKGKKLAKRLMFSPERILFIHGAKEHLISNGFTYIDRYLTTLKGEPYFLFEGFSYVLTDFIEGCECNFSNDEESKVAAQTLASLHAASKGYMPIMNAKVQDELGNLPACFNKRLEDIKKLKKLAKRGKSRFDHLFLEHIDYFINIGVEALSELENSNYAKLVEKARLEGVFCHHDFTHHNILFFNNRLWVTNFDYCCYELKIYDLANLIRRKMRKCDWDIEKAKVLINGYTSVEKLSTDEIAVMKLILLFPQKFWRVVNRYYNSRRSWSERSYVVKLQEVIDEVGGHSKFMEQFKMLL